MARHARPPSAAAARPRARRPPGRGRRVEAEARQARPLHDPRPATAPAAPVRAGGGRGCDRGTRRRRRGCDRRRGARRQVAPARPAEDRHGNDLRRHRLDQSDLVQPAVARGAAPAGHPRPATGEAGQLRLRREVVRRRGRRRDGGLRAGVSGERGDPAEARSHARRARARPRRRLLRPAARRHAPA